MPLLKGNSAAVKSENISEMRHSGWPQDEAIAAAMNMARKFRSRHAEGGAPPPVPAPPSYTRPQLERMHADDLDRMAYGHAYGDTITAHPSRFGIKYTGDLENPQDKFDKGGMDWARSVDFSKPVDLGIGRHGKLHIEDGHHRWFAAKKLGRKLTGTIVKSDAKPIEDILQRQERQKRAFGGPTVRVRPPTVKTHAGPIHSGVAGRTDHLPMSVKDGSYVLPADIVSGFGEGNTVAGFKVAKALPRLFATSFYGAKKPGAGLPYGGGGLPYGAVAPPGRAEGGPVGEDGERSVPIVAAGGEHVIAPDEVEMIGNGDLGTGHKILDAFVSAYRAHLIKTLKALPGPKRD